MRILADENVDGPIITWLRSNGHDVVWASELYAGASDDWLVRQASDENRVIITSDRDFGKLVFRRGLRPPGVALLRIRASSSTQFLAALAAQWPAIEAHVVGKFLVVSRGRIRVRPL